jgi:galactokinase
VSHAFRERFQGEPVLLVRAPGRVNLIGEHTDYNDGFVLPMAIDRQLYIALRPRSDTRVLLHSLDFDQPADFDAGELQHGPKDWSEYVKGVAWVLRESGQPVLGWEGVLAADLPQGAGLSSSAALELATLRAFSAVANQPWQPATAARLGQKVENGWMSVNSGIMDQLVVAAGEQDHALLIDCRSLHFESVVVPQRAAVIVLDTGTRRGLVESAYNDRRRDCETAARVLGAAALRDISVTQLDRRAYELEPVVRRRAQHVVTENQRTLDAADALRADDLHRLGLLMNASHASLRHDFEVTNDALDLMAEIAQQQPNCYGARMTGAGFGGCAIALVEGAAADTFIQEVTSQYRKRAGIEPNAYRCRASAGVTLETV